MKIEKNKETPHSKQVMCVENREKRKNNRKLENYGINMRIKWKNNAKI
ncbi:MAG: hypothetical protein PUD03_09340 [Lachnospiraceae bacterium]|nr:hypothetical protein [Lachnospiraceae bacterium]MDD5854273.1 hypothetical protein [Lachnospiraceae bacterium]